MDVKLTFEPGVFVKWELEAWMFVYGKSANNIVSEVKLTSKLGPSVNSDLLRWATSLNIRSKLKGQCKTMKYGSDTSLVPSLAFHSLSFKTFLVTLSL